MMNQAMTEMPDDFAIKESTNPALLEKDMKAPDMMTPMPKWGIDVGELMAEDQAFKNDLSTGLIKPKSYNDFFASQDTLGKVGTLFGLLLSGAGSGLTGQPNAVLSMMDKEIERDLEAQKSSFSNRMDLWKMIQQENRDTAQIDHWKKQGVLTDAQAKHYDIQNKIQEDLLLQTRANRIAFQKLVEDNMKLAPGTPERQRSDELLGTMAQSVDIKNARLMDVAAAKSALLRQMLGDPTGGQQEGMQEGGSSENSFQRKQKFLRVTGNEKLAEDAEEKHLPGVPGETSVKLTAKDREKYEGKIAFRDELQNFIEFLENGENKNIPMSGSQVAEAKARATSLKNAYRLAHGMQFSGNEEEFVSKIIADPSSLWQKVPGGYLLSDKALPVLPRLKTLKEITEDDLSTFLKTKGSSAKNPKVHSTYQKKQELIDELEKRKRKK